MPVLCRITTYWLLPRNSIVLRSMAGSAWIRPAAGRSVTGSCSFSGTKTTSWSFRRPETPNKALYSASARECLGAPLFLRVDWITDFAWLGHGVFGEIWVADFG